MRRIEPWWFKTEGYHIFWHYLEIFYPDELLDRIYNREFRQSAFIKEQLWAEQKGFDVLAPLKPKKAVRK